MAQDIKSIGELIPQVSSYYAAKKTAVEQGRAEMVPAEEYTLGYDSGSETLEPIYFWILDYMNGVFGGKVLKLVDNFSSSVGSGHFSELSGKASRMQEEAMKIYGIVNTVIKSVINIVYDLREFKIRLQSYEDVKSKNKDVADAGMLSLKQIWMDQVDLKKGRGSINMMAQDLNFITLRDAFMVAKSPEDAEKIDLNDRVKRILKARIQEFLDWKKQSEFELKKRYEIEKTYLRTQRDTILMYSKWARPYLIAAEQLRMKQQDMTRGELVNVFNTLFLELTLMGMNEVKILEEAASHNLPEDFKKIKFKRKYYSCVLVDFTFRGIPNKVGTHYSFGGKTEVKFRAYALNEEEIELLKKKIIESLFGDALKLVDGMTTESLGQLQTEIDEFLDEKKKMDEKEEAAAEENVNPFSALFGMGGKKSKSNEGGNPFLDMFKFGKKEEKKDKAKEAEEKLKLLEKEGVAEDNYAESTVRNYAESGLDGNGGAIDSCYSVYDVYKKQHGMASSNERI